jgi:hypothetical protein
MACGFTERLERFGRAIYCLRGRFAVCRNLQTPRSPADWMRRE